MRNIPVIEQTYLQNAKAGILFDQTRKHFVCYGTERDGITIYDSDLSKGRYELVCD